MNTFFTPRTLVSEGPGTDLRWTVIATYSPTTPPAVDAVATGSCLMIPSVMPDSREPVPTSSGFAITRRGGPRNVAATRAAGEEGCRVQAFEDADAAPRAPNRARVITSYQKVEAAPPSAHGDSHRPHCKSVTVASDACQTVRRRTADRRLSLPTIVNRLLVPLD